MNVSAVRLLLHYNPHFEKSVDFPSDKPSPKDNLSHVWLKLTQLICFKSFERSSVCILIAVFPLYPVGKGHGSFLNKFESLYTLILCPKFDQYFPNGYGDVENSKKFTDILRTTGDQKISLHHNPLSKYI